MTIASVTEILEDFRAGRMVILVDEEDRENEGDLILAAEFVSPEAINFMARYGRGLICLTLSEERCRRLHLPLMVASNSSRHGTNFTVSIEAAEGVSTGISAADRSRTVQAAVARDARPEDIVQPGHIFPLKAEPGGVLVRAGHTEAGCDLAQLAGLEPAAVICEILKDDGTMARLPDLIEFGAQHGLRIGTIADLIQYRSSHESLVERVVEREVATMAGTMRLIGYRDRAGGGAHLALVHGDIASAPEALVRVHEPLSVLELLDASLATHSWPLDRAMAAVIRAQAGVVVLLNCAQDSDSLVAQLERLAGQPAGNGAAARRARMDLRTYGIGAQILRDLGVTRMRVLAQPRKMPSMTGFGLEITGFEPDPQGGEA